MGVKGHKIVIEFNLLIKKDKKHYNESDPLILLNRVYVVIII